MTELDPNLILKSFATPQLDVGGLLETRYKLAQRNKAVAAEEAALQRKQTIGQLYGQGRGQEARQQAYGAGDFDLVKSLDDMDDAQRKRVVDVSRATAPLLMGLRNVPQPERKAALEQMAPALGERGFSQEQFDKLASGDLSDAVLNNLANSAMTIEEYNKANETRIASAGSAIIDASGKIVGQVPFAPKEATVYDANGNPQVVSYTPGGGAGGPLNLEGVRPHIVAQESHGDYTAVNQGTGALGAYQVMPQTGKVLAGRLGLEWRPDLMTSSTAEGKQYQDAVGGAAIQEAIDASGGDPMTMAQYYHGGSNRSGWGPKTQQYGREVTARLGGGAPQVIGSGKPKERPTPPSGYEWSGDGKSLQPIKGGPADKQGGEQAYSQSAIDAFDRAINTGNDLLKHPGLSTSVGAKGLTGGLLGGWTVPGTDAADFKSNLETMKSQVFLPMVQSMKGMGALSNAEGAKLTAAIGNLDTTQSEAQFKKNLQGIIKDLTTYRNRARGGGQAAQASTNIPTLTVEQARTAPKGTRFRTTDGREMVKK